MSRPAVWTGAELDRAVALAPHAVFWCLPRFAPTVRTRFGERLVDTLEDVPADATLLVVVGGGERIDRAKLWRRDARPALTLVAVPTLWGSGAEASKVVALNVDGKKAIAVDEALLPDARLIWPELASELPDWRAREACGDAWSHALEGFLSPLATHALRDELSSILRTMTTLPIANDPEWFEPSARACAAQARAGVGLVHGIAHVLEGRLAAHASERPFGHARLTSLFLRPVMALNRELSPKFDELMEEHDVDGARVLAACDELFDAAAYDEVLPVLEAAWMDVLRDPCSRTNSALVRPAHLSFFTERRFA